MNLVACSTSRASCTSVVCVIGEDGALSSISRALRPLLRLGLRNPRRPVSSLVFSGPTGVGKTELAKAVAESYYGAEKAMVRIDMS